MAVESADAAGARASADVEGRRASATATDGRHRGTANGGTFVPREFEPSAERESAQFVCATGKSAGDSACRIEGERRDGRRECAERGERSRRAGAEWRDDALYDSGAEVEPDV